MEIKIDSSNYYTVDALSNSYMRMIDYARQKMITPSKVAVLEPTFFGDSNSPALFIGKEVDEFMTNGVEKEYLFVPDAIRSQYKVTELPVEPYTIEEYTKAVYTLDSYKKEFYDFDKNRWKPRKLDAKVIIADCEHIISKIEKYRKTLEDYHSYKELVDTFVHNIHNTAAEGLTCNIEDMPKPNEIAMTIKKATSDIRTSTYYEYLLDYKQESNKDFIILQQMPIYITLGGVLCKGLIDTLIYDIKNNILFIDDTKTTGESFDKSYVKYKINRQLAWYSVLLANYIEGLEDNDPLYSIKVNKPNIVCRLFVIDKTGYKEPTLYSVAASDLACFTDNTTDYNYRDLKDGIIFTKGNEIIINAVEKTNRLISPIAENYIPKFADIIDYYKQILKHKTNEEFNREHF